MPRSARLLTIAFIAGLLVAGVAPAGAQRTGPEDGPRGRNQRDPAGASMATEGAGEVIADQYIVVFRPGTPGVAGKARELTRAVGGQLLLTYEHALLGFAARLPGNKAEGIRRNPSVLSIEPDRVAVVDDVQSPATWGLDRIDQRDLPLNNSYDDGTQGAGVHAYIIDTGIRATHTELTGRVGNGFDAVTSGGTANDCNGHGTHVAATVAGATYGVADKAVVHAVRVLNCRGSGTNSRVIAGVDWVRSNAIKPAVANMSLGGGTSSALDTAVTNLSNSGVPVAVAAGNNNTNACNSSPARAAAAITTGATTTADARSSFSNFGTCLDLFAPGSNITSAWYTSDTATNTISGTSMASPHVAGAAALHLSANPNATATQVRDAVVDNATIGKVTNPGTGSPNRLLYTGTGAQPPPPPPPPPGVWVNGGFEAGPAPWVQSSSGGYELIDSSKPRTGSFGLWLGGYNSAADSIGQALTVPANGALTYWWLMTSGELSSTVYDRLYVQVYDSSGSTLLSSNQRVTNASARNVWTQDTVSLSAYAGQTVRVVFSATTDPSLPTSFYIDDTSVA